MAKTSGLNWVLGARSETGYVRSANEDRMGFFRTAYGGVYIVSDGMGGYRGGALAAELTVATLRERLAALSPTTESFPQQVRAAFLAANQAVFQARRADDPATRDMGATGVALITAGSRALVGHVGDSRAYLVSGGAMQQLTRDHTRVQQMVDAGLLTPDQAVGHADASVLARAIGHAPTVEADVSAWITLKPGDMVLLCSDGLCGYVADAEISKILRSHCSPQALADKLVDCALGKGGEDNVTVQLVRLGGDSAAWPARWSQPSVVAPVSALATALVAWSVMAPQLETADTRTAASQKELLSSRQQLVQSEQKTAEVSQELSTLKLQAARPPAVAVAPAAVPAAAAAISAAAPLKAPTKVSKPVVPTVAKVPGKKTTVAQASAVAPGPASSSPPTPTPAVASALSLAPSASGPATSAATVPAPASATPAQTTAASSPPAPADAERSR